MTLLMAAWRRDVSRDDVGLLVGSEADVHRAGGRAVILSVISSLRTVDVVACDDGALGNGGRTGDGAGFDVCETDTAVIGRRHVETSLAIGATIEEGARFVQQRLRHKLSSHEWPVLLGDGPWGSAPLV